MEPQACISGVHFDETECTTQTQAQGSCEIQDTSDASDWSEHRLVDGFHVGQPSKQPELPNPERN